MRNWTLPDYHHLGVEAEAVAGAEQERRAEEERQLRERQETIDE